MTTKTDEGFNAINTSHEDCAEAATDTGILAVPFPDGEIRHYTQPSDCVKIDSSNADALSVVTALDAGDVNSKKSNRYKSLKGGRPAMSGDVNLLEMPNVPRFLLMTFIHQV